MYLHLLEDVMNPAVSDIIDNVQQYDEDHLIRTVPAVLDFMCYSIYRPTLSSSVMNGRLDHSIWLPLRSKIYGT